MNTLRPLLCREPLLPDESLSSYLVRLTAANCYEPGSILTKICNKHLATLGLRDNLVHPRHPETYDMLATLSGLAPGELANASIHRFTQAPILAQVARSLIHLSDGYALSSSRAHLRSRYFLTARTARFCPGCLREAAYHRLPWTLLDVTACLKHRCLLIDRCHRCQSVTSIEELTQCQCSRCSADLTTMATDRLTPFDLFTQRTIRTWWGLDAPPGNGTDWTLPEQPATVLYQLLGQLKDSFRLRWPYNKLDARSLPDRHTLQSLAFEALADWPFGFYRFLRGILEYEAEVYCSHCGCDLSEPVYLRSRSLFGFWIKGLKQWPEFSFVQKAVDHFFAENGVQVYFDRSRIHIRVEADEELQRLVIPVLQTRHEYLSELMERLSRFREGL